MSINTYDSKDLSAKGTSFDGTVSKSEERIIEGRLLDAANCCYNRGIPVCTDFLDLNKQTIFDSMVSVGTHKGASGSKLPPVSFFAAGGYDLAERKVIVFLPYEDFSYDDVPYDIIKISPANPKFAEPLTHRDYLGAVIGLGVSRDKFGDVLVVEEGAYIFSIKSITSYITGNLCQVRHTTVKSEVIDSLDFDYTPRFREIQGTVASLRLDSVIALGFGSSRSHLISYIENGRVAVNGRIITSNAYNLKPEDIISVRGLGKIKFINSVTSTKKGRIVVIIYKYI